MLNALLASRCLTPGVRVHNIIHVVTFIVENSASTIRAIIHYTEPDVTPVLYHSARPLPFRPRVATPCPIGRKYPKET
jgi:hypothetical protein